MCPALPKYYGRPGRTFTGEFVLQGEDSVPDILFAKAGLQVLPAINGQ
jgi:hypothetical protein